MGFNYNFTCPDIDKAIDNFKRVISDILDDIVGELNPMFYNTEEKIKWCKNYEAEIYNQVESLFEETRKCNSDIRDEADRQIDSAEEERDEYKNLYEEALSRIEELEQTLNSIEE